MALDGPGPARQQKRATRTTLRCKVGQYETGMGADEAGNAGQVPGFNCVHRIRGSVISISDHFHGISGVSVIEIKDWSKRIACTQRNHRSSVFDHSYKHFPREKQCLIDEAMYRRETDDPSHVMAPSRLASWATFKHSRNRPATSNMADSAEAYEQHNVHEVYQQIAGHFSATRYKVCSCQCFNRSTSSAHSIFRSSHGLSWKNSSRSCLLDLWA